MSKQADKSGQTKHWYESLKTSAVHSISPTLANTL